MLSAQNQHKTRIHLSEDGSHTLYSETFSQFFHNPNGAISESRHVFFETPGLINRIEEENSLQILEIGFGTGLNLLVLMDYLNNVENPAHITYRSIEKYPITLEIAVKLNYPDLLNLNRGKEYLAYIFRQIKPGFNRLSVGDHLNLELFVGDFFEAPTPDNRYDAILFDPFSPEVNPTLWSDKVFKKLIECCNHNAILSTYGAASSARAAMAAAGWSVARAPGALGKREMTIASPNPDQLKRWKRVDEKKLAERYRAGDFDQNKKPDSQKNPETDNS